MWPATKVCPKELFPLGRIPIIIHIVWELMDAGIEDIVIVAHEGNADSIRYLLDPAVQGAENQAADPLVQRFNDTVQRGRFTVIVQSGPYGNGTPLLNADSFIGDDACIYAFADDIVLGENVSKSLIETYMKTGAPVMACQAVEEKRKPFLGILEWIRKDDIQYITRFVEKPQPGTTESNLASLGRYLVTPEQRRYLAATPVGRGNELWFSDSVVRMLADHKAVCARPLSTGQWFTVGDPDAFAEAVAALYKLSWDSMKPEVAASNRSVSR